jgi:DNA-binding IclR family transcriptional regulator
LQALESRGANAQKVVQHLYRHLVADAARIGKAAGVSPASAHNLIAGLERLRLLRETTGGKRSRRVRVRAVFEAFPLVSLGAWWLPGA